jgi:Ca2+-dependent lipid-binding protein
MAERKRDVPGAGLRGTFGITVHKARNLTSKSGAKAHPYAKVTVGMLRLSTTVHKEGGTDPIWGSQLVFPVFGMCLNV